MNNFFAQLKRRHIYRVAAAYAVVAWVLIQFVNNVAPALRLPEWAPALVIVLLLVGFPITLLIAWTRELAPADGTRAATGKLDWALMGALVVVIGLGAYQQLAPTRPAQQASVAPGAPGILSIAVLPFANLSGDAAQEFFSDGMTEEITAALAKVQSVRMVGRSSAFQFKGQNRDLRAIGQALGATYLIDGSVRKAGDQVRITAQLIQADNGVSVWTDSYDHELKNIFATQSDIATAIAGALRVPLGLQQGESLVSNRTADVESYQQYLRARALYRARAIDQAIALLEPAIARDPNYAPAWALLAQAYAVTPVFNMNIWVGPIAEVRPVVRSLLDRAEKAAREAIRLDPRHAGGYVALAYIQTERGNWVAGDDLFRQALALDSDDPEALNFYSLTLASLGRVKQALSIREQLRTLEPFVPIYNILSAAIMQLNGQGEAAIPLLEAIPSGGAVNFIRNIYLAKAYAAAGRYGEAADAVLAIPANTPSVSRRSVEDAARLLRSAPAKPGAPDALPALEVLEFVYAYAGAPNRLMEAPERRLEIGYQNFSLTWVYWEPLNAPVRKTERFKAFARNAGLVEYWRARGWPDLCRPMGVDDFECD